MSLSDHERRLLAEMERALSAEDPKLVSTLTGEPSTRHRGVALIAILIGVATIFAGLLTQIALIGVAGFLATLAGTLAALPKLEGGRIAKEKRQGRSANAKIQDRWNRRNLG